MTACEVSPRWLSGEGSLRMRRKVFTGEVSVGDAGGRERETIMEPTDFVTDSHDLLFAVPRYTEPCARSINYAALLDVARGECMPFEDAA